MLQGLYFSTLKTFPYISFIILTIFFSQHAHADEESLNNIHQKLMEANSLKLQADYILNNSDESINQQHLQAYSLLYQSHTLKQQVYASMLNPLINQNTLEDSLMGVSATILSNAGRLIKSSVSTVTEIETQTLDFLVKIENYQKACHELSLATTGYQILYDALKNNRNDNYLNAITTEQHYSSLSSKYNQSISSIGSLFSEEEEEEEAQPVPVQKQIASSQVPIKFSESENAHKDPLVFAIQLAASRDQLNPDLLAHFKRKTKGNLHEVREGEWYKYEYRVGSSYSETHQMWLHFGSDVCFPVAYYKGEKISMQKALAMCEGK
ncbi:MAG: hypothetical protein JEZ14_13955 [Marinilabiliaceae bacterium]|nr:hypothetical protein [Marinilabiliaceae bacterium]